MRIAILALQGAFDEHRQMLTRLGVESFLVRNLSDWQQPKDGLIIPGGESTAMMKIMRDEGLFTPIRDAILGGLPVFGTCAGMILLDDQHLACMDITARRNAYGRQLGSFHTVAPMSDVGQVPMVFIRAPFIERQGADVQPLATVDDRLVAARQRHMLVCAFHPELTSDTSVHSYFLGMIR
ncbi:MAG: pyridoxal 5'-phosphate synthase glutaminase subunit PdxT [Bacteroidales bacterium]|nr:pyridoxal 5'-phosphate synthase glutaminase subunit PdxT [Candidatus Liminaster caballi]